MALFAVKMYRKAEKKHPYKIALFWTLGSAIVSFVGAGLLGFAHTLPQTNLYTHGTLVTAMHGHYAFWGAYAMIVLAIITYSMPNMTGRKRYEGSNGQLAFWLSNVGMLGMVTAMGVAGVVQVYLERRLQMEFMVVQEEVKIHFVVMLLCATLFAVGIGIYVYEFVKYGRPTDEALEHPY